MERKSLHGAQNSAASVKFAVSNAYQNKEEENRNFKCKTQINNK